MRFVSCALLISGWLLSLTALILLTGDGQRLAFLCAALLVEALGLGVLAYHYRSQRGQA